MKRDNKSNESNKSNKAHEEGKGNEAHRSFETLDPNDVASSTDCTGLMPTPPENEEQTESYQEIYNVPRAARKSAKRDK